VGHAWQGRAPGIGDRHCTQGKPAKVGQGLQMFQPYIGYLHITTADLNNRLTRASTAMTPGQYGWRDYTAPGRQGQHRFQDIVG